MVAIRGGESFSLRTFLIGFTENSITSFYRNYNLKFIMLKQEIQFQSYDLSYSREVKFSSILHHLQQIAGNDSTQYGLGYDVMLSYGVVFVLSKIRAVLKRPLKDNEKLVLTTHSRAIHGVTFFRDFLIEGEDGVVLQAESRWALLDFQKRTLARPGVLPIDKMEFTNVDFPLKTERLILPDGEADFAEERRIYPSMLDQNRHLNNCIYADLILDILPRDDADICDLQIDFRKEARCDQSLLLSRWNQEDGYFIAGSFANSQEKCFFAKVKTF